jgi:hypothetical protein
MWWELKSITVNVVIETYFKRKGGAQNELEDFKKANRYFFNPGPVDSVLGVGFRDCFQSRLEDGHQNAA